MNGSKNDVIRKISRLIGTLASNVCKREFFHVIPLSAPKASHEARINYQNRYPNNLPNTIEILLHRLSLARPTKSNCTYSPNVSLYRTRSLARAKASNRAGAAQLSRSVTACRRARGYTENFTVHFLPQKRQLQPTLQFD